MTLREIIALVQLGFAGFAAAMAVLSYRLIRLQVQRERPNLRVLDSLRSFTRYTIYLSLLVIVGTVVDRAFDYVLRRLAVEEVTKARQAVLLSQQAQSCRESLASLVGAESTGRSVDKLQEIMRLVHTKCYSVQQSIETLK